MAGEEETLAALLADIRTSVEGGGSPSELHSLEKKLAAAQNWVVTPPSVKDQQFKVHPTHQPSNRRRQPALPAQQHDG